MKTPTSRFFEGTPRIHYLEWNPRGRRTVVLLHGNSANAWWWCPMAEALESDVHLIAIDLRGHGDSGWVRPPAYSPADHASDLARFIRKARLDHPIIAGHSMGGICVLAFLTDYPDLARAAIAVDIAVTSTSRRNRYLSRLKSLPAVVYPDLETARARFRLMPDEGAIPPNVLHEIAEKSLQRTGDGRYTMKFDRESFFGSDGLDARAAIQRVRVPLLLVRAEHSRIMTDEAAREAAASNPHVQLRLIPSAHHHVLLERPDALAEIIGAFVDGLPTNHAPSTGA